MAMTVRTHVHNVIEIKAYLHQHKHTYMFTHIYRCSKTQHILKSEVSNVERAGTKHFMKHSLPGDLL